MGVVIGVEPYLVLETSRAVFRAGETAKVLQRWMATSGFSTESQPSVRTVLRPYDPDDETPRAPVRETRFPPEEASLHVGTISTEGLPSGGYLLQALAGVKDESVEAEESIVVLSVQEYDRQWSDLAADEILDQEAIGLPQDLVAAVLECVSVRLKEQFEASGIVLSSIRLNDIRSSTVLSPLRRLSWAAFDWAHTHLLAAAYEVAFGGGNLTIDLAVMDDGVATLIQLEELRTDIPHTWPPYLKYLESGVGAVINEHRLSQTQYAIECRLPYDETPRPASQSTSGGPGAPRPKPAPAPLRMPVPANVRVY